MIHCLRLLFYLDLGFIGGSIWHFFGGIRNAPSGKKLELAWSRVTTRAPILGGEEVTNIIL